MNLPDQAIEEFQQLWFEATNESIDFDFTKKQAEFFLLRIRSVFDHPTNQNE